MASSKGVGATAIAGAAAVVLSGLFVGAQSACQLQGSCDPSSSPPDHSNIQPPKGDRLDANNWESGPITGTFIDFPGGRTQVFDLGIMGASPRTIANITMYVSPDPHWIDVNGGSNFAQGAGNLAEVTAIYLNPAGSADDINVTNATCAHYYLRVEVQLAAEPGTLDPDPTAGSDAGVDAGALDSGADASLLDSGTTATSAFDIRRVPVRILVRN